MTVVPYKTDASTKKNQVAKMFNNISSNYDFLNHFLSLGIDIVWRKKAIGLLKELKPKIILDVATGTGDFAIASLSLRPLEVIGIDISDGMLEVGRRKLQKSGHSDIIKLINGDSENLPFRENKFDAVIVAFGVRNFENLEKGLGEIMRVLRPGGKLVVLEFSKPSVFPIKQLFSIYFAYILPMLGKLFSRDKSAYTYLPESVNVFPYGSQFTSILTKVGFNNSTCEALTFGISSLYTGVKQA